MPRWGRSPQSRSVSARFIWNSSSIPGAIRLLMYTMASFDVDTSPDFSKEASSSSWTFSTSETTPAISLSDSSPRARMRVMTGMSTGDPGMRATISPSFFITSSSFALYPTMDEYTFALKIVFPPTVSRSTIILL